MKIHENLQKIQQRLIDTKNSCIHDMQMYKELLEMVKISDIDFVSKYIRDFGVEEIIKHFNITLLPNKSTESIKNGIIESLELNIARTEKHYEMLTELYDVLNRTNFSKPMIHMTEIFDRTVVTASMDGIELEEVLDIMLLLIYRIGTYYRKNQKEWEKVNEYVKENGCVVTPDNVSQITGYACYILSRTIDKNANVIPNVPLEIYEGIFEGLFLKEVIDHEGYQVVTCVKPYSHETIMDYFRKKYTDALKETEIKAQEEKDNVYQKELKKAYKEKQDALKKLSEYYQNGVFIKIPRNINEFDTILHQTGLDEVQTTKIKRILEKTLEKQSLITYPTILTEEYQKEIYDQIRYEEDEIIKYYLSEIETADLLYKEADEEEKNELRKEVSSLIDSICYAKNINQEEIKLRFILDNQ